MDWEKVRDALLRAARQAHAPEPEDCVHDVIVRMLSQPRAVQWQYWLVAVRNRAHDQQHAAKRIVQLFEDYDAEEPHDSERRYPDIPDSGDKRYLLDYYSRRGHTPAERVEAFRARKRLRERNKQ